jgi:hypothetical protein
MGTTKRVLHSQLGTEIFFCNTVCSLLIIALAAPDVRNLEAWISNLIASCGLSRSPHVFIHHGIRQFPDPYEDSGIIGLFNAGSPMDHWRAQHSRGRCHQKSVEAKRIALIRILRYRPNQLSSFHPSSS